MLALALIFVLVLGLCAAALKVQGATLPTMSDLEASNHAAARALDDAALASALRGIVDGLDDPALRAEIGAVLGGRRPGADAGARWSAGLWAAIRRRGDLMRPGNIEGLWFAEGALRELARRRSSAG